MMRIRFRASYFGQIAKNKSLLFVQIETGFLLCETDAEMVPGPFVCLLVGFFSSSVRFWTLKMQANVDYYCYVWRRAEFASLGPGLKHPSLR